MWICLHDAFLSIVAKDCKRDELLVRARRRGDIERIFPGARVRQSEETDYRYRATIKKRRVADVLARECLDINYPNFKATVRDAALHRAYESVWHTMYRLQPARSRTGGLFDAGEQP